MMESTNKNLVIFSIVGLVVVLIILGGLWMFLRKPTEKPTPPGVPPPSDQPPPTQIIDHADIIFTPYRATGTSPAVPNTWYLNARLLGTAPPAEYSGIQLSLAREDGDPLYSGPGGTCEFATSRLMFNSPICEKNADMMVCSLTGSDAFLFAAHPPAELKDKPCPIIELEGDNSQVTYGDPIRLEAILLDKNNMPVAGTEKSFATQIPNRSS